MKTPPVMQNIPIRTAVVREIREALLSKETTPILDMDFAYLERLVAERLKAKP